MEMFPEKGILFSTGLGLRFPEKSSVPWPPFRTRERWESEWERHEFHNYAEIRDSFILEKINAA